MAKKKAAKKVTKKAVKKAAKKAVRKTRGPREDVGSTQSTSSGKGKRNPIGK